MEIKTILKGIFIVIVIGLLTAYWFMPLNSIEFTSRPSHSNFTLNSSIESNMQFYNNLRYSSSDITYKLNSCPLQKEDAVERAFDILEEETILTFTEVSSDEDLTIACDGKVQNIPEKNFFIAGEGGPTNITITSYFNVIQHGSVLLIREAKCERPNIALHEILHALGFDHSENPNNIMYKISDCDQEISEDIINTINELYSYPPYPELSFEEVSAIRKGRLLDVNISIRNNGLKDASNIMINLYVNDNLLKEFQVETLTIGTGKRIFVQNLIVSQLSFDELELEIYYSGNELDKTNNNLKLKIKE